MEIFVSWFDGFRDNRPAVESLKQSGIIAGIELTSVRADTAHIPPCSATVRLAADEGKSGALRGMADYVRSFGLKAGLHDPLKNFTVDLSDRDFRESVEGSGLLPVMEAFDTPFVSFHLGFTRIHEDRSAEEIFRQSVKNIEYMASMTDKKILFETPNYFLKHAGTRIGDVFNDITSPGFVRRVMDNADCGFLLDLSHTFISGMTRECLSGMKGYCEEYVNELLGLTAPGIHELHVSSPERAAGYGIHDAHGFLKQDDEASDSIMKMCLKAVKLCGNLSAVTLEMNSRLNTEEHADELVDQARRIIGAIGANNA